MEKFTTVEAYLAAVPAQQRTVLERLRKTIRSVVPEAGEKISYGIPTFTYHGNLVHYAAFKNHLSFYPAAKSILKTFATDLEGFETSAGATIRFTPEKAAGRCRSWFRTQPIPATLVRKIVRVRADENRARAAKRKQRD